MSILSRLGAVFGRSEPKNAVEFTPELWEALKANSISNLSWRKAVEVSAVLACARIYANDLAAVPWKIMQDKPNGDKEEARDHRYYDLIRHKPNNYQTSFEFRQTIGFHLALEGNAFIWMDRAGPKAEKIVNMLPLEPSWVSVSRDSNDWGRLKYRVSLPNGQSFQTDSHYIWHIRNLSWNSYSGLAALSYAKDAISLADDITDSQSDAHKNYAKPSGVLSVDQVMDAAQFTRMRALVDMQVEHRLSRGLPMVTDKTMKWEQLSTKATDLQTVEARQQIVEEIAVHMGILPAIVGFNSKGSQSYASVEQLLIRHNIHFKMPLLENFMQSSDRWILSKDDRKNGFYNHMVDQAILRGDIKARAQYYRDLWMIGAVSGNEVRAFEEMNGIDGLDRPWAPLANAPIGEDGMPQIADRAPVDNRLKQGGEKDIADLFLQSDPQQRERFVAIMQELMKPEEGGNL